MDHFRGDREVAWCAVRIHGDSLKFLSDNLRSSSSIVRAAVATKASAFRHAAPALRSDRAFVTSLVSVYPDVFAHCSRDLQRDFSFVVELAKQQPAIMRNLDVCGFSEHDTSRFVEIMGTPAAVAATINQGGRHRRRVPLWGTVGMLHALESLESVENMLGGISTLESSRRRRRL
tara:strand:+ start:3351 stop:3875 length:525 start_codon:yes stop_codon:yes gene_type:complete